jgi:hypothetical protein
MRAALAICLACAGVAFAQGVPPSRQAEGAMLSDHVYNLPLKGSGTLLTGAQVGGFSAPSGYRVVGGLGNDASGFQGAIYQSDSSGRYTVVYRGTELGELKDLQSDASIKFGGTAFQKQLADADKLTDYAVQTYGKENVSIAGHSLGGAIAQVESARVGLSAEAYNAPGMLDYVKDNYPNARVELITNHNRASDVVSSVGEQPGYVRTYPSTYDGMADLMRPGTMDVDPNAAMALANIAADHSMTPFAAFIAGGGTPIDPPTLHTLDGKSSVIDQWGDGGATVRRKEFEAIAQANADEARSNAAAAQAAATLSADPPPPDPMMTMLSAVLTAQANGKTAPSPAAEATKGSGAACPRKTFNTPDGCHPGHDEKAHPGGCYCG